MFKKTDLLFGPRKLARVTNGNVLRKKKLALYFGEKKYSKEFVAVEREGLGQRTSRELIHTFEAESNNFSLSCEGAKMLSERTAN